MMPQQTLAGKGDHCSPHMMATNQMYSVCMCIGGSILASLSNLPLSLLYMYLILSFVYPVALIFYHVADRKSTVDLFLLNNISSNFFPNQCN